MTEVKKSRFEYLDGIRGVAAIIVVINHFRNAFYDASLNSNIFVFLWDRLKYFFFTGEFCVQLFFVLSGFVLAYNSFYREGFLNKQWVKRVVRLALPVSITSIFYWIFVHYRLFYFDQLCNIYCSGWASNHWVVEYSFMQFTKRLIYDFFLFSDWQFIMNNNSSLWTIPVELYWSYLLFIIFYFINKLKSLILKNGVTIIYAILLFLIGNFKGVEYLPLFVAGALLALNFKFIVSFQNNKKLNVFIFASLVILTYIIERNWLYQLEFTTLKFTYIIAILYVFFALRSSLIQQIFSHSIIKWLGKISFALYLIHLLVIGSISSKLFILFPFLRFDFGLLILLVLTMSLTLIASHLFTNYIDENLMKKFDEFLFKIKIFLAKVK